MKVSVGMMLWAELERDACWSMFSPCFHCRCEGSQ